MSTIAPACAPVKPEPLSLRSPMLSLDAHHYRFERLYGQGPAAVGLILDCPESPRLGNLDLQELYGDNHDQAPGDPEDIYAWTLPDLEWQEAQWGYDLEYEQWCDEQHNREVMGYSFA